MYEKEKKKNPLASVSVLCSQTFVWINREMRSDSFSSHLVVCEALRRIIGLNQWFKANVRMDEQHKAQARLHLLEFH